MSQVAIVYPLLVQVALTLGLLLWLAVRRTRALRKREVQVRDIALGQPNWPAEITQIGNSFRSQFEVPVLFYVLVLLVLNLRMSDIVLVVLGWMFVLARLAHAYVHTTSNRVRIRGPVYGVGLLFLLIMWIWFALRFLTASG